VGGGPPPYVLMPCLLEASMVLSTRTANSLPGQRAHSLRASHRATLVWIGISDTGFTALEGGDDTRIGKDRPYMGRVVEVEGLCHIQSPDDKDTLRVEIELGSSGLEYIPGDALGIHASNAPEVATPHPPIPPPPPHTHTHTHSTSKPTYPGALCNPYRIFQVLCVAVREVQRIRILWVIISTNGSLAVLGLISFF